MPEDIFDVSVQDVRNISGGISKTDEQIQEALDAERAVQLQRCVVATPYQSDLRRALLRRVQRALALDNLPVLVPMGDSESEVPSIPYNDPEIRRLEAPWRKMVTG